MEIDCKSLNCTECCEKYWITLLPEDAKNMASELKISEEEFLKNYCTIFIQLFPAEFSKNKLKISTDFLPKQIADALKTQLNELPNFVLVLPTLALKKDEFCIFLENQLCKVHKSKPAQCKFFPFISYEKNPDFTKIYPFCKTLHVKTFYEIDAHGEEHYKEIFNYFESVKKEGFLKHWKTLPDKGVVVCKGITLGELSADEILKMISPIELISE
ncbi:MAG: YkgJ family cysteine cluster protein [Candidatus Diapherotrites archaeon]